VRERVETGGRVEGAVCVARECKRTGGRVFPPASAVERPVPDRRVAAAPSAAEERILTLRGVLPGIASVLWRVSESAKVTASTKRTTGKPSRQGDRLINFEIGRVAVLRGVGRCIGSFLSILPVFCSLEMQT